MRGGAQMRSFAPLGLIWNRIWFFDLGFELVLALASVGIAGLIFMRKRDDWMALLVSIALVMPLFGTAISQPVSILANAHLDQQQLFDTLCNLDMVELETVWQSQDVQVLRGLIERSRANLKMIEDWVEKTDWIAFLAESAEIRSNTSVCLSVVSAKVQALPKEEKAKFLKGIVSEMGKQKVAYDIGSYRDAPPGFRFWGVPSLSPPDIRTAVEELGKIYREKIAAL